MSELPAPGPDPYTYKGHTGIDFLRGPSHLGKPFYASGPGTVLRLSKNLAGGCWVVVKYDNGFTVGYAHMRSHTGCPRPGTRVSEGTRLGYVGDLGARVTGPHIHVEIIGIATPAAVWECFDRDRQIGQAAPAGGASGSCPARKLYGAGWVIFVQDLLGILGHDTGGRDGRDGAKTQAAVKHEQGAAKSNGYGTLVQDGIAGPASLTYLLWAVLKFRTKGEKTAGQPARSRWGRAWVKLIQRMLVELGHPLTVDGADGAKTQAAVRHEQGAAKSNGYGTLTQDGIAGFDTAKYLVWAIAKFRLPWA